MSVLLPPLIPHHCSLPDVHDHDRLSSRSFLARSDRIGSLWHALHTKSSSKDWDQ